MKVESWETSRPSVPAPAPDLAVVIVNYESGDFLRACLAAVPDAAHGLSAEVVVVDNASSDGSLAGIQQSPALSVIRNPENVGFARACNQAVAATASPFVCFLNPDAVPRPGSLARLLEAAREREDAGAVGPRVLNPDGSLQPSCRLVPSFGVALGHALLGFVRPHNRFTRAYMLLDWDHRTEREVDWVSASAMLVRREAFEAVGGFDDRFFMYVEDLDLCDRMRRAGWKIVYFPEAEVVHHVGGSSRRLPYRMIRHHHRSALRYAYTKARGTPRVLLLPFIALLLGVRLATAWLDFFLRNRRRRTAERGDRE